MRDAPLVRNGSGVDSKAQRPTGQPAPVRSGSAGPGPTRFPPLEDERTGLDRVLRVLGDVRGSRPGPTFICLGSLHGNEPAGVLGLQRVFAELTAEAEDGGLELRGRFVGLSGNIKALAQDQRFLVDDLNRSWWTERVERVLRGNGPLEAEDEEMREIERALRAVLAEAEGDVFFLDVHTTSGEGGVFSTYDDMLANRRFARSIPVPQVLGIEEELCGTLVGNLNDRGLIAIGFEAGQHKNPLSIDRAEAAIWIALEAAGLIQPGSVRVAESRELLRTGARQLPTVVEVRYRHAITDRDGFVMRPGYRNFQHVEEGEILADDLKGPVPAPVSGMLLMPLYQGQGEDGFFVIRPVHPAWLGLSAALRYVHLERFLHWLPGVRKDPDCATGFVVDRHQARWLALQIFHLLGFKRRGKQERYLRMYKRGQRP